VKLDWVRSEIERMRGQIRAQEREIRMLQRAGVPTASAELLLTRTRAKLEDLCRDRDALRKRRSYGHAKLRWLKANYHERRIVEFVPSGMSARSGAVTVAETRTPRHSGLRFLYLRPQRRRRLRERRAGKSDGTKSGTAGWTAKANS
jgi:hypothetical protein